MPIRHPLCPYDRHPLLEPGIWVDRLEQSNRAIAEGRSDLVFTASNSFALLLAHCGSHDVAAKVLRASVKAAVARPDPAPFWFDSFFNFVRLANRTGDQARFRGLLAVCVDALLGGDVLRLPKDILGAPAEFQLKDKLGVLLRQHLIYEIMVHSGDQTRNDFRILCLEPHIDFESAGLIFREFTIFASGESNLEAGALVASPGGLMEGLIRALYAFEVAKRDGSIVKSQEFLAMSTVIFMSLVEAGKIDQRCLRVVETLAKQGWAAGRDDVAKIVLNVGMNVTNDDWYMKGFFKALQDKAPVKSVAEAYAHIRPALLDLAERWAPLAS